MRIQANRTVPDQATRGNALVSASTASSPASTLGLYMREMSVHDVMTPAQERRAAEAIVRARVELWTALLGYPPFVAAVVETLEVGLPTGEPPQALLHEVVVAARALRDRQTRKNRDRFEQAGSSLARALASIDTDGDLADPIVTDLRRLAQGDRRPRTLRVTMPPVGSAPFTRHVERVEEAVATLLAAKNRFVRANLRLVVAMARRYDHGRLPLADLIQEGNLGLLKAVDRFDPRRGFRFSTYASWWIRHAIGRALADKGREVRVPVHMIDVHHRLQRTRQSFEVLEGRTPGNEELAAGAGVPLEKVERLQHCLLDRGVSLDTPVGSRDARTLGELLEDESLPAACDLIADRTMEHKIRDLLGQLRPIEADVLRKRFGLDAQEPMTLREIGDQYSLSRERIRQVQEQALGKIRHELRRQQLI
jgi:RNA polymerase primary sigma factor